LTDQHVVILARLLLFTSTLCATASVVVSVRFMLGSGHKLTGVKLAAIGLVCSVVACVVARWA
jgi:hypothetical protein